jgi:hypothetical protein
MVNIIARIFLFVQAQARAANFHHRVATPFICWNSWGGVGRSPTPQDSYNQ